MARNKTFRRKWTLEIKGTSTNNFMQKFIDKALTTYVRHISDRFASIEIVGFQVEELSAERETSKKLRTVHKCPKCGAQMWNDGAACLLCAFEEDGDADADIRT